MRRVLSTMRRADQAFDLIADGDVIAVGVSGGKDSMVLLKALLIYQQYSKKSYTLHPICIDLGFKGFADAEIDAYGQTLGLPLDMIKTDIGKVVFDIRKEPNPCSLCANMRRGALYSRAAALGCNKVAYAHHLDDALTTLLMSMTYESRMHTLQPKSYLSRKDLLLIRPLLYCREEFIVECAQSEGIPYYSNPCPANGQTKRGEMAQLAEFLDGMHEGAHSNWMTALRDIDAYSLWNDPQPDR